MLTRASRNCVSAGRYGFPFQKLRHIASSKPSRVLLISVLCVILIFTFGRQSTQQSSLAQVPQKSNDTPKNGRFSLLVPATSTNPDLCKLMLSGQILQYPTPILINYGATESEDPYVQHLAKVDGILQYLNRLVDSDNFDKDLALIVDGYDMWFQLPTEVLLRRYYELNAAANARLIKAYGEKAVIAHDIRQTIVFGQDKICWPTDMNRPACWAVSNTNLDDYAFGPETSGSLQSRSQPRWLNSGTIIGPVRDLKALFEATLAEINANHTTDSDQFYLAEVYGKQEFARLQHNSELLKRYKSVRYGDELGDPNAEFSRSDANTAGLRTEYHIGIDYESKMFQTLAYWKQYLTWLRPSDSWFGTSLDLNPYALQLPTDLAISTSLFDDLQSSPSSSSSTPLSWHSVELLYNTITGQVPAMVHFTGEKRFRHIWWKKIWFQSRAKQLREASTTGPRENRSFGPIGGYIWYNAESPDAEQVYEHGVSGAWSDRGGWFSWKTLCSSFEDHIYEVPGDGLFHAALEQEGDNEAVAHAEADAAPGKAAFRINNQEGSKSDEITPLDGDNVGGNVADTLANPP